MEDETHSTNGSHSGDLFGVEDFASSHSSIVDFLGERDPIHFRRFYEISGTGTAENGEAGDSYLQSRNRVSGYGRVPLASAQLQAA
jgi:hypothetical protein